MSYRLKNYNFIITFLLAQIGHKEQIVHECTVLCNSEGKQTCAVECVLQRSVSALTGLRIIPFKFYGIETVWLCAKNGSHVLPNALAA